MKKWIKALLVAAFLLLPSSVSAQFQVQMPEIINNTNTDKSKMININEFAKNNGYVIEPFGKSHVWMSRKILYKNEGEIIYFIGLEKKDIDVARVKPEELPGEGLTMVQQSVIFAKNLNLEKSGSDLLLPEKEFISVFKKEVDPKTMTIKKDLVEDRGEPVVPKYTKDVVTEDEVASIIKQYGREGRPEANSNEISIITKSINDSIKSSVGKDMNEKETLMALKNKLCVINKYDYAAYNRTGSWLNYADSYSALGVAQNGTSVCSGYAEYYMIMCRALGFDTHIVHGDAPSFGRHVWVSVYLNGVRYHFDPTWDDRGDTPYHSDQHSFKTDKEFRAMGYVPQKEFWLLKNKCFRFKRGWFFWKEMR